MESLHLGRLLAEIGLVSCTPRKMIILVYVDEIELAGKRQNIDPRCFKDIDSTSEVRIGKETKSFLDQATWMPLKAIEKTKPRTDKATKTDAIL